MKVSSWLILAKAVILQTKSTLVSAKGLTHAFSSLNIWWETTRILVPSLNMQTFLSSTLALKKSAASSKQNAKRFSSTSLFRNSMQTSVSATLALISQLSTCFWWWIVSWLKLSMLKSSGLKPIPMRLLVSTNSTTYCRSGLSIKLICPMRTSHRSISIGLRNLTSSRKRPTAFFEGIDSWLLSSMATYSSKRFLSKFSLSKTV